MITLLLFPNYFFLIKDSFSEDYLLLQIYAKISIYAPMTTTDKVNNYKSKT